MTELLPPWPLIVGAAVLVAAFVGWAACASAPSHRPTREPGVSFCDDCSVPCSEAYPCFCCREFGFHRGGETGASSETDRRIKHARGSNG